MAELMVFIAWTIIFCSLVGLGYLVKVFFNSAPSGCSTAVSCFWLGFAIVIAALQIWNIFAPIDWKAGVIIGLIGVGGFVRWLSSLKKADIFNKVSAVIIVLLIPLTVWLTNRSLGAPLHYDSGLYHFNSIRWANEYAIVPGLGNLHGRLAFNQSYLLYVSMLNLYPFVNQGHHFANSLLLYVLIASIIGNIIFWFFHPKKSSLLSIFQLLSLPIIVLQAESSTNFSSPTSDLPVFILQFVMIIQFMEYLFYSQDSEAYNDFSIFTLFILSIASLTIKLNLIVFSFVIIGIVLAIRRASYDSWLNALRKTMLWLAIGVCGLILPWMVRSIIMSGYIVYPGGLGALPMDWTVPSATAIDDANWIRSWARQPGVHWSKVLGNWNWFYPWLQQKAQLPEIMFPIFLSVIGITLLIALALFTKERVAIRYAWLPFLPPLCSLVFWFFSAPEPRFAGSAFWILGFLGMSFPLDLICRCKPQYTTRILLFLSLGATALVVALHPQIIQKANCERFCPIPEVKMKEFTTASGLILYIPVVDDRSWNSTLPSTPYANAQLELRGSDLQSGFRIRADH